MSFVPFLAALLLVAPASTSTSTRDEAATDGQCEGLGSAHISVRTAGGDTSRLRDELRLRVPCTLEVDQPRGGDDALLEVELGADEYRIALALPDGRIYRERGLIPVELERERVAASAASALISAIQRGDRREDEQVDPPAGSETAETADHEDHGDRRDETELAPGRDGEDDRNATNEGAGSKPGAARGWAIGPEISLAPLLAAGPPGYADVYLGAGGELGARFEATGPLRLWGGMRMVGRRVSVGADPYSLLRTRVSAGVGGGGRMGPVHASLVGGPMVEAVVVTDVSGGQPLVRDGRRVLPMVLGAFLRAAALVELGRGRPELRVGPTLDLQVGAVPTNGGAVAGLRSPAGRPIARVGGLEMTWGLSLQLLFRGDRARRGPR